jgi:glycosyltransferase involved in cell wall biosynthesis
VRVLVTSRWYPAHDEPHRARFVADQIEALVAQGVSVVVASWEPAHARGWQAPPEVAIAAAVRAWTASLDPSALARPHHWGVGVSVARLPAPMPAGRRDPATLVDAYAALLVPFGRWLMETWPFDVIHAHPGIPDGLAAARLGDALGIPVVTTEHEGRTPTRLGDPTLGAAYRGLIGPRRTLIAVSSVQADRLAIASGIDRRQVDILPNAIPIESFPVGPRSARDPNELLYVGNRSAAKGTETLLRAFARCRERQPRLRLRLIGRAWTAVAEAELLALADTLGIAGSVSFEGTADRAAVATAMRTASLFVHPSKSESFGVVAAEALCSGLPVVSVPNGGVEEILGGDESLGTVSASTTADDLADAIERTLSRVDTFDPVRLHGEIAARYDGRIIAARLVKRYEALVGGHGSTPSEPEGHPGQPATATDIDRVADGLPIVVALDRSLIKQRVAAMPPALARQLVIVTGSDDDPAAHDDDAVRDGPRIVVCDIDRVLRARARRIRWVRRGALRPVVDRLLGAPAPRRTAALGQVLANLGAIEGPVPSRRLSVLAVDVDDVAAVAPLVEAGTVRLRLGGLRALADRWDEAAASPDTEPEGGLREP